MKLRDVCEHVCIFVCFVFVLFVNVCHEWAGKLKDVEFFVGLVQNCDVRLEVRDQYLRRDGATSSCLVSRNITLH